MRHKYLELDGLRGLAAFSVALLHTGPGFFAPSYASFFERQAFLAVDFFLMLSGFVVAYAYEARLAQPGNKLAFLRDRIIRLHPLLILGAVAGVVTMTVMHRTMAPSRLILYAVTGSIPLPLPNASFAFPANFPSWSLFWELLLNIAFAFIAPLLTTRRLVILICVSGLMTLAISLHANAFDLGAKGTSLIYAGPRLTTSFLLGVALLRVHRSGVLARGDRRFWPAVALLVCLFLLHQRSSYSLPYDFAAVAVVFPLIILGAAGSEPIVPMIAKLGGAISYPLYILQIPLSALGRFCMVRLHVSPGLLPGTIFCFIFLPIASYAAFRWYDEPIRAILRQRFGSRRHRAADQVPKAVLVLS